VARAVQGVVPEPRPRECPNNIFELWRCRSAAPGRDHSRAWHVRATCRIGENDVYRLPAPHPDPQGGGACGMYRPPIGPVSAIERAIVCMRMPGFSGLASADFEGVFAHSYKRCRPRLFLRALRKEALITGTSVPSVLTCRSGNRRASFLL